MPWPKRLGGFVIGYGGIMLVIVFGAPGMFGFQRV